MDGIGHGWKVDGLMDRKWMDGSMDRRMDRRNVCMDGLMNR